MSSINSFCALVSFELQVATRNLNLMNADILDFF